MAAIPVNVNLPASSGIALTTALQLLTPATEVGWIDFVADAACYLVVSASGSDGGSISGLTRMYIPANTIYPIPCGDHSTPIFVAAVTGSATGYAIGLGK